MHKIIPYHSISKKDVDSCVNSPPEKGFCIWKLTRLLETKSCLKHMRIYPSLNLFYVYCKKRGIYIEMDPDQMKVFLGVLLFKINNRITDVKMLIKIYNEILYGPKSYSEDLAPQLGEIIPLSNGNLISSEKIPKLEAFSPKHFFVHRSFYPYNEQASCPKFLEFLEFICHGKQDRIKFLQCWLYATLYSLKEAQVFLNIWGPNGTGKSTLKNILTALVGRDLTLSTTLKALHMNPFEIANLKRKKLILINDTAYYRGNLSTLKLITGGGDGLKGRIKFVQGNEEIATEGLVLIVGNYPMNITDVTGQIQDRLRMFPTDRIRKKENLIFYNNSKGEYGGKLVDELPGILNWVLQENKENVLRILRDPILTPSLASVHMASDQQANPILRWIREELEEGEGTYLGYKISKISRTGDIDFGNANYLYPAFLRWALNQNIDIISHVLFGQQLVSCLTQEGYRSVKQRRSAGTYITSVQVKKFVNMNKCNGAVVNTDNEFNEENENQPCLACSNI